MGFLSLTLAEMIQFLDLKHVPLGESLTSLKGVAIQKGSGKGRKKCKRKGTRKGSRKGVIKGGTIKHIRRKKNTRSFRS
tara:strand:+ start:148 stop:384 length:237 start_codon:yes stop_codon:yes gene_type:complete